jgi:flavin-binding protein dodecin
VRGCGGTTRALPQCHMPRARRTEMSDRIYKKIELTGTSTTSVEEAIENAIARAATTVRKMRWFEVVETRGRIDDGKVAEWQVTLKIGFALEDE